MTTERLEWCDHKLRNVSANRIEKRDRLYFGASRRSLEGHLSLVFLASETMRQCMSVPPVCLVPPGGLTTVSDPWELKLELALGGHVGARN